MSFSKTVEKKTSFRWSNIRQGHDECEDPRHRAVMILSGNNMVNQSFGAGSCVRCPALLLVLRWLEREIRDSDLYILRYSERLLYLDPQTDRSKTSGCPWGLWTRYRRNFFTAMKVPNMSRRAGTFAFLYLFPTCPCFFLIFLPRYVFSSIVFLPTSFYIIC